MDQKMKLNASFYLGENVVKIAEELIGKYIFTSFKNKITGGIITETEAYNGVIDRASHAFGGKRTSRTEIMFMEGGVAYIYLCYGIHSLFNVVTNKEGIPHAVLIRAIYPIVGMDEIRKRWAKELTSIEKLCIGPGTVAQALGIHYKDSGENLMGKKIWIEDKGLIIPKSKIIIGPRIGVDYAGKDALLPYRFQVNHNTVKKFIERDMQV